MGRFLNKGNLGFESARNGEYVDKSAMIQVINETLDTENFCSCVTRCRRFGKSMAAKMLYAYYDKSCDSWHLFEDLAPGYDSTPRKKLRLLRRVKLVSTVGGTSAMLKQAWHCVRFARQLR